MSTTRREFLGSVAAGFAAAALPHELGALQPQDLVRRGEAKSIAIMGAGLAGLSAGYELTQAGHEVTILEARNRPGGRVLTIRQPFADGLYAEAGALFVPSHHTHTMRYVRKFDLPLVNLFPRGNAEMFYIRSKRYIMQEGVGFEWALDLTPEEQAIGPNGMWRKYINPVADQITTADQAKWPPKELEKYDQMTMAEFLKSRGASPDAIALLRMGYLDLWGDGVETSSALGVLRDIALRKNERQTYAIKGGNDQLPKALADRMKSRIKYGAAITRIEQNEKQVTLSYRLAGESKQITADRVICAIPFSVLRTMEVSPAWSASKKMAVDQLPYTSVARVYLQSRTRFWRAQELPISANTDLPIMWLWDPSSMQSGTRGILESYIAGPQARRVTAMKEHERISFVLEEMEKPYPGIKANFELGVSKCWDEDEWSRGDYAWFKPGQVTSLLPHIARPEGRIHFAGEHASPWPGWMQGALESGNRAAKEVNEAH